MSLISALDPSPRLIIRAPYVTIGLVAAHVAVFVLMVSLGEAAALDILRGFSVLNITPLTMTRHFSIP